VAVGNKMNLELIENDPQYFEFIRRLRNHPQLRIGFIQQDEISVVNHANYMLKYSTNYFICLLSGVPIGFIGVIDDDIRLAVDPSFQNLGVARFMVEEIVKIYPTAQAKVKVTNLASMKLFQSLNFTEEFVIFTQPNSSK
jgi:ribosomal protein S18 acetylase RimI-like enzyme